MSKRKRQNFTFWLDVSQNEQRQIAEALKQLKRERRFAPVLRDALALYFTLGSGSIDELDRLFPFASQQIRQASTPAPNDDTKQRLAALEQLILENSTPTSLPIQQTKQLAAPSPYTADGDSLITVEKAKDDHKSGWNALISMALLNGNPGILPPEVRAHGVQTGRIPASAQSKKTHHEKPKALIPVPTEELSGTSSNKGPKTLKEFKPLAPPPSEHLPDLDLILQSATSN